MADVAQRLQTIPGSHHVIRTGDGYGGAAVVTADLVDDAVDRALEQVKRLGVPADDVVLVRLDSIGPSVAGRPLASVVWADLLSQAGAYASAFPRYLVFMATAGVIAVRRDLRQRDADRRGDGDQPQRRRHVVAP